MFKSGETLKYFFFGGKRRNTYFFFFFSMKGIIDIKSNMLGFPSGSVVKSLPAIVGGMVQPLVQKTPHATGQLNPQATISDTCGLQLRSPCTLEFILHKRSHHNGEPTHRSEEWPPFAAARGKPVQPWRASAAKNKRIQFLKIIFWFIQMLMAPNLNIKYVLDI